ncbi:MAG: hypothetical protein Q7U51_14065 [Methanoregula sp.]|nr:hypothetical protein [Methanoregula sp.]
MEIESTNYQCVAGTGQKNATGINKHQTGENREEFFSLTGFDSILKAPENPYGFSCSLAIGQIAGTTLKPAAFTQEIYRASLKKSQKTLVIGMGVLYNGEIRPVVNRNYTTAPAIQDAEEKSEDVGEKSEDLIISLYEKQDRMVERATKKIDRLNSRLTALKEHRRSV